MYQDQKDWLDKNVPNMGVLFRSYVDKLMAEHDEARIAKDKRDIPTLEQQIKGWKEMLAKKDFSFFKAGELVDNIKEAERVLAYRRGNKG